MDLNLSPAEALKLFEEQGQEETPVDEPKTEPEAKAEPVAEAAPAAAKTEPEQEPVATEPEGVATKDGKHVIPYSVLQSERTRAANSERALQEALGRIAELTAQPAPNKTANEGVSANTTEQAQEEAERLAQLNEDFPTVAAELKAMRDLVKQLETQLKPLKESTETEQARRANETAMTVQEAIDTLPKMAHIQSANPEAFELAKQFDATLRDRADWAGKPMTERFAKVVELVEASMGAIEVPGQKSPPVAAPDPASLKAAAAAKLADAPKAVPTSLSQFPAGDPVATDEAGAAAAMSTAQIAAKFAKMTPPQMDAYLASL